MAENKKGFILYADWIHTVEKLPDDKAGLLIKHILRYVNDLNPETDDLIVSISFEPIKQQLKRDLNKWESIRNKRSEAGKASAEKRQQNQQVLTSVESVEQTSTNSTVSVNVNVTDTVNVNDNVKVTNKNNSMVDRKQKFALTLEPFLPTYGRDLLKDFYGYWTEPNKSGTKFRQEMEKTWDLERRLNTWAKRDKSFSLSKQNQQPENNTFDQRMQIMSNALKNAEWNKTQ